jgi:hypothetical protein
VTQVNFVNGSLNQNLPVLKDEAFCKRVVESTGALSLQTVLNDDVFQVIYSNLSSQDLRSARLACRQFRKCLPREKVVLKFLEDIKKVPKTDLPDFEKQFLASVKERRRERDSLLKSQYVMTAVLGDKVRLDLADPDIFCGAHPKKEPDPNFEWKEKCLDAGLRFEDAAYIRKKELQQMNRIFSAQRNNCSSWFLEEQRQLLSKKSKWSVVEKVVGAVKKTRDFCYGVFFKFFP